MNIPPTSNPNTCTKCGGPYGPGSYHEELTCQEVQIERLTRELAEITADRDNLRDLLTNKGGMPSASSAHETCDGWLCRCGVFNQPTKPNTECDDCGTPRPPSKAREEPTK